MSGRQPILVIEADHDLGQAIVQQLVADEHPARLARSANHATVLASHAPPALVVLGTLEAPNGALALLRTIRGSGQTLPGTPTCRSSCSARTPTSPTYCAPSRPVPTTS